MRARDIVLIVAMLALIGGVGVAAYMFGDDDKPLVAGDRPDAVASAEPDRLASDALGLAAPGAGAGAESRPSTLAGAAGAPPDAEAPAYETDYETADVNDPASFPEEPGRSFIDLDTNRPDQDVEAPALPDASLGGPDLDTASVDLSAVKSADPLGRAARRSADAPELAPKAGADSPGVTIDDRPEIDVVRIAQDGSAVVAGRAQPRASVDVIIDGELAETVRANDAGEFVALISAPEGPAKGGTRRIDLAATGPDGLLRTSEAPVVLTTPGDPGEPPVALRPKKEGVELLQPSAESEEGRVTIDRVTYGGEGEVKVAGRGKPGEVARLYLDNALEVEARVSSDGSWIATIPREIPPAVYKLRVDQTTTDGIVTSRAETPFERASPNDIKLSKGAVVVQPGNNLWRIADFVYGSGERYTVIYRANRSQIRDPDLIYPGQILDLPRTAVAE